jgi:hypothetical protein
MARYVLIHSSSNLSLIDQSRLRVSLIQTSVTGPDFGQSFVLAENIRLIYGKKKEPTSGLEPLTPAHYECAVRSCWALQGFANPA